MKKLVVLFFGLFLSLSSHANKCCYCEIGDYPSEQQGFFKVGCNLWLAGQKNCDIKEIVPQNTRYQDMNLSCANGEMSVGYVGHWGSSYQMVSYLQRTIVPAMQKHNVSVKVDNTACLAMDNPNIIHDYIKAIPFNRDQFLDVKGNQVLSIGKWDSVIGKSANFAASVSSRLDTVDYPSCKSFRGYNCVQQVQLGQYGYCRENNGSVVQLTCCGVQDDSNFESSYMNTVLKYQWVDKKNCVSR